MSGALYDTLVSSLAILALVFAGLLRMALNIIKAIRHIRMKQIPYIRTEDATRTKPQATRMAKRPLSWWRER